jgi:DNA-binding beta-propeller fold protein YncE
MRSILILALLGFLPGLAAAAPSAAAEAPLALEATIPLEDVGGRIDHMAIDLARRRLLVAELGHGSVDVIDLAGTRRIHQIAGLKEPQGLAYVPGPDLVVVASGGDGSVRFFRGDDYAPAGVVELGEDADNVRVDLANGQVVVGYGSGGLAVIDPATRSKLRTIPLPAHPEGFQLDPGSERAFVNLPDARQIAVVDPIGGKLRATWPQKNLRSNFPIALDAGGNTVASVFRSPPRLVLFDADSGAIKVSVASCGDADDLFFDNRRRRIYVSCGEGMVDVLQRDGTEIGRVPTRSGARTSLFVPELDRLIVAARAESIGGTAKLLVYRPTP